MQLLGPVIDIHQKEVVQDQVLDEGVAVISVPVSDHQRADLAYRHLSHSMHVLARSLGDQNILRRAFIKHLEEVISAHLLAVRGRGSELLSHGTKILAVFPGNRDQAAFQVIDAEIDLCDAVKIFQRFLDYLSRNHICRLSSFFVQSFFIQKGLPSSSSPPYPDHRIFVLL